MQSKQSMIWWKISLTALLFGLVWLTVTLPAQAQEPIEENQDCLTCHSNPDLVIEFEDGSTISGHINGGIYDTSVHGQEAMTCGGCHPNHQAYPHPKLSVTDSRSFTLELNDTCLDCHPNEADWVQDSNHAVAMEAGHPEAAVCVDCHGAHDTLPLHTARVEIAATCRQCHSMIYDEYGTSAHGHALHDEGNTDVPTCVDCHGVHTMEDPHTIGFRLNSPLLCANCHADEALMAKYDISTDVFDTYVADFHGSTVTLFEKLSPDAETNKAVCYDCHGVHAIRAVDDPEAAVIKENLLKTCQKCHPDATANFPDSWTSHYPPTFERQPLVSIVNLFYLLFIPGMIGFMGLFVVTDAGRKLIGRDTAGSSPGADETTSEPAESKPAAEGQPDSEPEKPE
jgi:nitrate/TMAO reductase-like tetraheme cytochrome c subunit